jgi:hypothetical protein
VKTLFAVVVAAVMIACGGRDAADDQALHQDIANSSNDVRRHRDQ